MKIYFVGPDLYSGFNLDCCGGVLISFYDLIMKTSRLDWWNEMVIKNENIFFDSNNNK